MISHRVLSLFWIALPIFLPPCAHSRLSNYTVDDAGPDPVTGALISYTHDTTWNFGPVCPPCMAHLDPKKVFNMTWHDATYDDSQRSLSTPQNATFNFTG